MQMPERSIVTPLSGLLICAVIVAAGSAARGDDSETIVSLKQRNLKLEAELKAANAKNEQLTNEVNQLKRKLAAIRSELDADLIPADVDAPCYNELRNLQFMIRDQRKQNSPDFTEVRERAAKISKQYVTELKKEASSEYPIKQQLLWALRDELPRMLKGDLTSKSPAEVSFNARLDEAEKLFQKLSEK